MKNEPTETKVENYEQEDSDTERHFIPPEEEREPWTPQSPDPKSDDKNSEAGTDARIKDGKCDGDEVKEENKAERPEPSETKEKSEHSEGNNDSSVMKV